MLDLSSFSLQGKVALVTGGSRGIGQAVACGYAKAGAKVVVSSRKAEDLAATVDAIRAFGGEACAVAAHLGRMEEIPRVIEAVLEQYGRLDILFNNAGASPAMGSVLECEERLWDTVMNLNLKGVYFLSQAAARVMKDQGGGKIINVASVDGFKPEPGVSVYSVSKAGVRMITNAFAAELAPFNIQVNTIAPGPISTKMMNSHWAHLSLEQAAHAKEHLESALPTGRIGDPEEIVGAAIYLASASSSYTTGTEIIIDGALLLANPLQAEH